MAKKAVTGKIKITLERSTISQKPAKRATVRSLGLKKVHSAVVQDASPAILGMVAAVQHLVSVEEAR
jgi:large subunit ribosomal protein L30